MIKTSHLCDDNPTSLHVGQFIIISTRSCQRYPCDIVWSVQTIVHSTVKMNDETD